MTIEHEHLEELKQLFFNLMCFRLGGQVDVTAEDIVYLTQTVERTQILVVQIPGSTDSKFVLRTILTAPNRLH